MSERVARLRERFLKGSYEAYLGLWYTLTSRWPYGTNVYDRDWDVLLVLDACRVDALRAVADEYDFLTEMGTITSVGSHSMEWIANTFSADYSEEIRNTAYLTANTHAEMILKDGERPPRRGWEPTLTWPDWDIARAADFASVEFAWYGGFDDQLGNVPPRHLTDRLVDAARRDVADRYVVHYMQPHDPFIGRAVSVGRAPTPVERDPVGHLKTGRVSRQEVWEQYLDNLRLVLDDVTLLLDNLDAERVVITADHGEGLGEWGVNGHPEGVVHGAVRRVPWVETRATDRETHEPDLTDRGTATAEEHLRALGYVE